MRNINNEIILTINKIRPFLQRDAGDVKFIKFEDGFVYLEVLGACIDCSLKDVHILAGLESILVEEVSGVIGVKLIEKGVNTF